MFIKKVKMHLHNVLKHKWYVFIIAIRAGIPIRGFFHDMSKFSYTEFFESAKNIESTTFSPIKSTYKKKGYSKAWLHHRGHNKHHAEYWYDEFAPIKSPLIPYPYVVEMICDKLAASIVYMGKNWSIQKEIDYLLSSDERPLLNEKTFQFIITIMEEIKKTSIQETISPQNLKKKYQEICVEERK